MNISFARKKAQQVLKEKKGYIFDEDKIIEPGTDEYTVVSFLLKNTEKGKRLSDNLALKVDYAPEPYSYDACFYFKDLMSGQEEWVDFSIKKAGKSASSVRKEEITQAFRWAVEDQRKDFLQKEIVKPENKVFLEMKKKDPLSVHADHLNPSFKYLLESFLMDTGRKLEDIDIIPFSDAEKQIADKSLEKEWWEFHKKNARWQLLPASENIKKGAS